MTFGVGAVASVARPDARIPAAFIGSRVIDIRRSDAKRHPARSSRARTPTAEHSAARSDGSWRPFRKAEDRVVVAAVAARDRQRREAPARGDQGRQRIEVRKKRRHATCPDAASTPVVPVAVPGMIGRSLRRRREIKPIDPPVRLGRERTGRVACESMYAVMMIMRCAGRPREDQHAKDRHDDRKVVERPHG